MITGLLIVMGWYSIGVLAMLWVQRHVAKKNTGEAIGNQEVYGLAITGPIILFLIVYWLVIDRKM